MKTTSYLILMVCQAEGVHGEVEWGVWKDMGGLHVSIPLWHEHEHEWLRQVVWGLYALPICHGASFIQVVQGSRFKVQVSRIMSFGWQIVCVIDTVIQMRRHGLVRELLWHMWCLWCLCDVECRDFSVWQGDWQLHFDKMSLTKWVWQKHCATRLRWCMCCMWYSIDVLDVLQYKCAEVHAWCIAYTAMISLTSSTWQNCLPTKPTKYCDLNLCGLCKVCWSTNSKRKSTKTTAPRIPAWSPTVVLTRRHPG